MAARTLTTTVDATNATTGTKQYAKIVLRNMDFLRSRDHLGSAVIPIRTESNPSPVKKAASNRQPGQSNTRTTVDEAINHELAKARYLIDDLADHVFGHIVSTELARDILRHFVYVGIIQIFEGVAPRFSNDDKALDPSSEIVQHVIEQAFEEAAEHGCIRKNAEGDVYGPGPSSVDRQDNQTNTEGKNKFADSKGKEKQKQKKYSFKWSTFPTEPIDEDELVKFLNKITDDAFNFAQPRISNVVPRLRHRFAAREDKHHPMPLSYEPDREDMRPDFLLLPMEAFRDNFKTVDPKYLNFTASRLVGEAKNKDLVAGVEQVQRYARGLKCAQPWVHYVLAMAITKDKAVFMRGEGSGMERLELMLADARGCIEFIRILLGLALAEDVDLGQNPEACLQTETRTRRKCGPHASTSSNVPSTATTTRVKGSTTVESATNAGSSCSVTSEASSKSLSISSRTRSASRAPPISSRTGRALVASSVLLVSSHARVQNIQTFSASSASSKRTYSQRGEAGDGPTRRKKRKTTDESVSSEEQVVFFPLRVYSHTCLGIMFTSSSIRGRGTTVFCVLDLDDPNKRLAFKMSWQDLERLEDQEAVMKRLQEHEPHRNVIVPISTFKAQRNDMTCTTLGVIRGFLEEQISLIDIENRVLTISTSQLKRPVAYFWGLHDFVRGLRGALLGHEFLTKIGILHRDVSENNIVLGAYPWEERGYLIDFDMAILLEAERGLSTGSQVHQPAGNTSAANQENKKHVKGLRTGTFPYISFSVLLGEEHTHFNDVESFLYVLLLFFFSYAGALSKTDLGDAHRRGFVQPIGSGRLPHLRNWPQTFADWADGDPLKIAQLKYFYIGNPYGPQFLVESAELRDCLQKHWPPGLHDPIRALLESAFTMFRDSARGTPKGRTEVSHAQFVRLLDEWLEKHSALEAEHSNCPDFTDPGLDSSF